MMSLDGARVIIPGYQDYMPFSLSHTRGQGEISCDGSCDRVSIMPRYVDSEMRLQT